MDAKCLRRAGARLSGADWRVLTSAAFLLISSQAGPAGAADHLQPYLAALSVPHLRESVNWYRENLGFKVVKEASFPAYKLSLAILERDGFRLELVEKDGSSPPGKLVPGIDNPALIQGFGKLAFRVPDADAWAARLKSKGVRFQLEPSVDPEDGSKSFIVLDNGGNWLEFTAVPSASAAKDQEKALTELERRRSQAILTKDLKTLEGLYADDFRGLLGNGRFVDKAGLFEIFKAQDPDLRFTVEELEARVLGDAAVTHGKLTGRNPKGEVLFLSKFTHVYVWRDGRWQVVEGTSTPLPQG